MSLSMDVTTDPRPLAGAAEAYAFDGAHVRRTIVDRDGNRHVTRVLAPPGVGEAPFTAFSQGWLARAVRPPRDETARPLTSVDLFAGCGGLSLGLEAAAEAIGRRLESILAVDTDVDALTVFERNFSPSALFDGDVTRLVDGGLGEAPSFAERRLRDEFDGVDFVIGGPPCQGHSDLNNHTRRRDPKNALYLRVARFAEIVRPRFVLVENVPGVAHDRRGVVPAATQALARAGYFVSSGVIRADRVGAAQTRRRHLLLASRDSMIDIDAVSGQFTEAALTVDQALHDVPVASTGIFDTSSNHSAENRRRINYLFDHGLWDLPDAERPDCHRLRKHSYKAVYGRMRGDQPAPTITRGFGSTGQGRFVHPHERRTLTPHEAARIQGFPDYFDFSSCNRRVSLHSMIGNAVPSRLAYAAFMTLLLS
ncbi:DNA cytosine methyltransferase [Egicoccus sp. AB-alg2]|uniref:DNA cytosine methyltransferase n=1 Tax=Egicoccus sp. AB-alg2 TaxID=3242693 RepID=UPI00359E0F92